MLQLKPLDPNVPIFQQITADVSPRCAVRRAALASTSEMMLRVLLLPLAMMLAVLVSTLALSGRRDAAAPAIEHRHAAEPERTAAG